MNSINTYRLTELAEQRKKTSDLKNQTADLTIKNEGINENKCVQVSDKLDGMNIFKLLESDSISELEEMLDSL